MHHSVPLILVIARLGLTAIFRVSPLAANWKIIVTLENDYKTLAFESLVLSSLPEVSRFSYTLPHLSTTNLFPWPEIPPYRESTILGPFYLEQLSYFAPPHRTHLTDRSRHRTNGLLIKDKKYSTLPRTL